MAKLLYIEASPRQQHSFSSRVANTFIEAYQQQNPDDEIERLALFEIELPTFGREGTNQKMAHITKLIQSGKGLDAKGQWSGVVEQIERFCDADKIVISSPMWNFSIPYPLKHYIDLICQPGLTFTVNRKGEYVGLVVGKPMQLILARGSEYSPGFPSVDDGTKTDFQQAYLLHIGRFLGFEDIRSLILQPTEAKGGEAARKMLDNKLAEAKLVGSCF